MTAGVSVCMLLQRSMEHDARVRREAAALVEAGYEVTVLEIGATGEVPGIERRSLRVPFGAAKGGLVLRAHQLAYMGALFAAVLRMRPAIVHAHDVATLVPGALAARIVGALLVYDAHELASGVAYRRGLLARMVTWLERIASRRAVRVITVSDSIADRIQATHGLAQRPLVLRNFCALPRPDRAAPDAGLREQIGIDGESLVLHQGAAAPGRGCEKLIRAIASLPDAHLAFLGTPDDGFKSKLAALARELGVAPRVHFVPPAPPDRLLAKTREADVGVTLFEAVCENYRLTLPNKLFEYVAAGIPVIGSSTPEVERVIAEHEIGWTVDPSDPEAVAQALRLGLAASRDPDLRARVARADTTFSWADESTKLVDAYRAIGP